MSSWVVGASTDDGWVTSPIPGALVASESETTSRTPRSPQKCWFCGFSWPFGQIAIKGPLTWGQRQSSSPVLAGHPGLKAVPAKRPPPHRVGVGPVVLTGRATSPYDMTAGSVRASWAVLTSAVNRHRRTVRFANTYRSVAAPTRLRQPA